VKDLNGIIKSLEDHVLDPKNEEFKDPTMYQEEKLEAHDIAN
jgi:hypothetical protein